MSNESLVLTLDFGTQSVRAALTNKQGEIVICKSYVPDNY